MDQEVSKYESYARAFAEKAANSFFSSHGAVTTENLLSVTPVEQVNLLVAKNLFVTWKSEVQKLKSPYFNYESEQVVKALGDFMNTLSRHISVSKEFFKPLLEKAVLDTLLLVMKPELYVQREFSGKSLRPDELKEQVKYFRVHKGFWASFADSPEVKSRGQVSGEDIRSAFVSYLSFSPVTAAERDQYTQAFSRVLPFETVPEKPAHQEPVTILPPKEEERHVVEQPKEPEPPQPRSIQEEKTINEKFSAQQLTVHELLQKQKMAGATVADHIGKSRIESIRGAISLSQKFLFINALFGQSFEEYEAALNNLDNCNSYQEALDLVNTHYASRYHWNYDTDEVKEFIEILERKFSGH